MANVDLFKVILSKSVSNKYIHFILILVEFFFLFFPSSQNITKKILLMFSLKDIDNISVINGHFLINTLNSAKTSLYSFPSLLLFAFSSILLLLYLFLFFCYKKPKYNKANNSKTGNIIQIIIVNIFDIIFFRYFSFIFIDNLIYLLIFSLQISSIENNVLAITFFIVLYVYMLTSIHYIRTYNLEYSIKNTQISHQFPRYPFNSSMLECHLYLFLIKVLISLENNFSFKANTYNHFSPSINMLSLLIIVVLSIRVLVLNTLLNYKEAYHDTNIVLNLFKHFLIMVNLFMIVSVILFSNALLPLLTTEIALYTIGNCIIGLIGIFCLHYHMKTILFNGKLNLNKILLLMIHNDSNEGLYYYRIYNKISINHFLDCNKQCAFCQDYHSRNLKSNSNYNILKPFSIHSQQFNNQIQLLFKHYKNEKAFTQLNSFSSAHLNNEIMIYNYLLLLKYRIQKKVFKFFYHYSLFRHSYSKEKQVLINNIELMIECSFKDDSVGRSDRVFFDEILSLSNINKQIYNCLIPLKDYIILNISDYFPVKLLEISHKFSKTRYMLLNTLLKTEVKDESMYQNTSMKLMLNILEYSLTISRYILETLFNETFKVLSPLEIEIFEEYLSTHYANDKALILSIQASKTKETPLFNILKFTGVLASNEYSTFTEYFPKIVSNEGEQLLVKILFSYIEKDKSNKIINSFTNNKNYNKYKGGDFQFITQNNEYISYIKYSFQLSSYLTSIQNNMLLFGFYSIDYENIVLLEQNERDIILLGFSKEMKKIFLIQSKWLEYLSKYQISFKLNQLFKSIRMVRNDCIETPKTKDHSIEEYSCVLQYNRYSKIIVPHLEYLLTIEEIKNDNEKSNLISQCITNLLSKLETEKVFKLKKLFSISQSKTVYCYISLIKDIKMDQTQFTLTNKRESEQVNWIQNNTLNLSTSSVHERSLNNVTKESKEDHKNRKQKEKENCKAERKKMHKYSVLTIVLSLIILMASISFSFIQSFKIKEIKAVSDIFNQYQTSKLSFFSIFNSLTSTLCYAKSLDDTTCVNELESYSIMLHEKYDLPQELLLQEYMGFEIQTKVKFFLDMFTGFKTMVYNLNDKKLIDIPLQTMNYTMLDLTNPSDIKQRNTKLSFDEGIRIYYNTYLSITKFQYQSIPLYFFTMKNSTFSFENLNKLNRSLTELEINLYTALMNFYNYDHSMLYGETVLLNKFDQLKGVNQNYLIFFIVLVLGLNIALYFLSKANIITAFELFRDIIYVIHSKIAVEKFRKYYIDKINNLITLSLLYHVNPNDVIRNIQANTLSHNKLIKKNTTFRNYSDNDGTKSSNKLLLQIDKDIITKSKKKNEMTHNTLYNHKILQYVKLNMIFFGFLIIFVGIVNVVVLLQFNFVVGVFAFNVDNSLFTNVYFIIIAYSHLHYILNTTEADLISALNQNVDDNELINFYIQRAYRYYYKIAKFHAKKSKYPLLESYFTYECNNVVKTVNDSFVQSANLVFEKNYSYLSVFVCEHFDLLKLRNFDQMNRDLLTRMRNFFLKGKGLRSYEDLVNYNRSKEIIDLYLILLIFMRPLKKFDVVTVMSPLVSKTFKNYIYFVIGLLFLNSCLEIICFGVIKWVLIRKLVKIQDELFLLKKCFD